MTESRLREQAALRDLLTEWLPRQRWFGGKGRPIHGVDVVEATVLRPEEPYLEHLVVAVDHDGEIERYQVIVGLRPDIEQRLEYALIGRLDGGMSAYDATHDPELTRLLLEHLAAGTDVGPLRFRNLGGQLETERTSIVLSGEQSNTSLVFGDDYILKLFRKVAPGLNPDLEITRALAESGSTHIAPPLAWIESDLDGEVSTFAMLQPFLRSATDGWALATTSVRDLYAEADLHADEVGGDFAAESERLGAATAEVHLLLAKALPSRIAEADESAETGKQMHERLDAALAVVPELAPFADPIRHAFDAVAGLTDPVPVQRIHGDYHLGQVLRTDEGWVLLDFEGEPARPLAERRRLASPLRDVAGMLRSFDYAARHLLSENPASAGLEYRAAEWAERNRDAFCDGYAHGAGRDPRDDTVLLRAFELDKAVYEVVYEARNRPTWLPIPLGSIERLVS